VFTTSGTYPWSFVTHIFHNGQPIHGGDRKSFEVMTSTLPKGTLVASLFESLIFFLDKIIMHHNKTFLVCWHYLMLK